MDKIVLDTNVLIDGVKDEHSAAWQIINQILEEKIQFFVSHPLKREYYKILRREISDTEYSIRIDQLLNIAKQIEIHDIQRVVLDDPEDDKVLATALAAEADFLISEDKHLLDLPPLEKLKILKPKEYLNHNAKDSSWSDFARLIGIQ